jgi:predicted metalloprotease with PDZ domain
MPQTTPIGAAALLSLFVATGVHAQRPAADSALSAPVTDVRYEVRADRAAMSARRLHVTTTFDVGSTAPVLLSLPLWTPGSYENGDFARNVGGFGATEGSTELRWDKVDFDTWRVRPARAGTVTVRFDVAVPEGADNGATWTRSDLAIFNGTNLFLYPEGRSLDFPAAVRVVAEPSHRVVTGMTSGGAARTYRAPTYHELVDMPFMVGAFDLDSASISGRVVRYATYPVGSVAGATRAQAWDQLKRLIPVQSAIFGDVPWPNYTLMQVVDSASGGYSGLEHANSHLDIVAPMMIGSDYQPSLYAHEIFHAWNVKRLRPADLTPYRYDRRQPTPWLWVSEGVTDYYADLSQVRAGTTDLAGFYALTAGKIAEIEQTVPFALEDASLNAWIHPRDGTETSYYPKGSLAGLMLDVAIRDASDNAHSLDDVMRELYETTFKKGRGFTAADWWGAVQRAANGRSFDEFNARYIDGRDPYPWTTVLATVGLRLVSDSAPRLGIQTIADSAGGVRISVVAPDGPAAAAGVLAGDQLLSIGEITVSDNMFPVTFRARYGTRAAGSPLPIVVQRAGQRLTLQSRLTFAATQKRIEELPGASARAMRLRNGILRGITTR